MYIVHVYNTYVCIFIYIFRTNAIRFMNENWYAIYGIACGIFTFQSHRQKLREEKIQPKKERSKYECTKRKVRLKLWLRTNLSFTAKYTFTYAKPPFKDVWGFKRDLLTNSRQ